MLRKLLTTLLTSFLVSCNAVSPETTPIEHYGKKEDAIGTLYLYSFNGNSERVPFSINLGHAFIAIENTSESELRIGAYDLEPGYTVSIGSWSISAHFGLWYNVESNYMDVFDRFEGIGCISTQIDSEDVSEIDEYIESHDYWTLFKNCSFMALDMYNLAASEEDQIEMKGLITPTRIFNVIKRVEGFETNKKIGTYGPMGYAASSNPENGIIEYHV